MEKDTEHKILESAEQEFLTKGFAGARTTAIAERAGVTHAMLHYYFRTKENLYERIVTEKLAKIREIVWESLEMSEGSLESTISSIMRGHLDFLAANPGLPRFLLGELYSDTERSLLLKEKLRVLAPMVVMRLQRLIDTSAEAGECRRVDARMLLLDMISLNVFPYMATPLVEGLLSTPPAGTESEENEENEEFGMDSAAFLEHRKNDNIATIMNKLRP